MYGSLVSLLNLLERSSKVSIVFLDACRNNPLTRSLTGAVNPPEGLAPQNIASGSYIAFATAPLNVAYDGLSAANSPFTAALLNNIGRENIDIRLMMADVREDVFDATAKKQLPWENNSLIGRFYFREGATPETQERVNAKALAERDAFDRARAAGTADALQEFLAKYPDGLFGGIAHDVLADWWRRAKGAAIAVIQFPTCRAGDLLSALSVPSIRAFDVTRADDETFTVRFRSNGIGLPVTESAPLQEVLHCFA